MKKLLIVAACIAILMTGCNEDDPFTVKDKDGNVYKTVKIGDQVWMAQNLNFKTENSWCYDDNPTNCETFGRHYIWSAAKSACPKGWHLPSKDEFETFLKSVGLADVMWWDSLGVEETAGKVLKSTYGWHISEDDLAFAAAMDTLIKSLGVKSTADKKVNSKPALDTNGNGTDDFGFAALPAGRGAYGSYYDKGNNAYFWSSTEYGSMGAYIMTLKSNNDRAYLEYGDSFGGFSVRCVKDARE